MALRTWAVYVCVFRPLRRMCRVTRPAGVTVIRGFARSAEAGSAPVDFGRAGCRLPVPGEFRGQGGLRPGRGWAQAQTQTADDEQAQAAQE